MWKEAAMLVVGCVLFVNMGLSDAIQQRLGFRSSILSCPKCCSFWASLIFLIFNGCRLAIAVGASFLFSYLALWADLGLSALNKIYNELYTKIESATPSEDKTDSPNKAWQDNADMPEVRSNEE